MGVMVAHVERSGVLEHVGDRHNTTTSEEPTVDMR